MICGAIDDIISIHPTIRVMHYIVNAESGLFCNKDHEFRAFLQKCGFSVYSIEIKAVQRQMGVAPKAAFLNMLQESK